MIVRKGGRVQVQDFCIPQIQVNRSPKAKITQDRTSGEERLELRVEDDSQLITIHVLVDPEGQLVLPVTQYLYYLKKKRSLKDTGPAALGLLLYFRFLRESGLHYDKFPDDEYERATYRFAAFLKECVADPETKMALSTVCSRMRAVIGFYTYLGREGMIEFSENNMPFEFMWKTVRTGDRGMLAHTRHEFTVQTTDIMASFDRVKSKAPHRVLCPMKPDHKRLFESQLDTLHKEKELMLRLGTECGLRRTEMVTFPVSVIKCPHDDQPIKVAIGPLLNGCQTKNSKQGEIEVEANLMWELYDYSLSEARKNLADKGLSDGRLFLSRKGLPFSPNTVDTFFAAYRKGLILQDSTWYYVLHDLRATFATYKLDELWKRLGSLRRAASILQELMRHESFTDTQKYLEFAEHEATWIEHGTKLNTIANKAVKEHN